MRGLPSFLFTSDSYRICPPTGKDWDEFGYEWSVFEKVGDTEKILWEGFKYISFVRKGNKDVNLGRI